MKLTCDLDLVPQLSFVPFHLGLAVRGRGVGKLACVQESLALEAGQTLPIVIRQAGRHRAQIGPGTLAGIKPRQPLGTLLLQLLRELLDGQCLDNILGSSRQQGKYGIGTICLVLFESSPQTIVQNVSHSVSEGGLQPVTSPRANRNRHRGICERCRGGLTSLGQFGHCSCARAPRKS